MGRWIGRVLLVLAVALAVPSRAWANVEDYETALMTPEQLYQYEYVPEVEVRESTPVVRALPDDADTTDWINDTVNSFNVVPLGSSRMSMQQWLAAFLGVSSSGSTHSGILRAMYIVPAVGIVFMWWGVRKVVRIVMASARKGKTSL